MSASFTVRTKSSIFFAQSALFVKYYTEGLDRATEHHVTMNLLSILVTLVLVHELSNFNSEHFRAEQDSSSDWVSVEGM